MYFVWYQNYFLKIASKNSLIILKFYKNRLITLYWFRISVLFLNIASNSSTVLYIIYTKADLIYKKQNARKVSKSELLLWKQTLLLWKQTLFLWKQTLFLCFWGALDQSEWIFWTSPQTVIAISGLFFETAGNWPIRSLVLNFASNCYLPLLWKAIYGPNTAEKQVCFEKILSVFEQGLKSVLFLSIMPLQLSKSDLFWRNSYLFASKHIVISNTTKEFAISQLLCKEKYSFVLRYVHTSHTIHAPTFKVHFHVQMSTGSTKMWVNPKVNPNQALKCVTPQHANFLVSWPVFACDPKIDITQPPTWY